MNLIIYLNIQMKELIKETGQTQSVSFDIIFDNDVDTDILLIKHSIMK